MNLFNTPNLSSRKYIGGLPTPLIGLIFPVPVRALITEDFPEKRSPITVIAILLFKLNSPLKIYKPIQLIKFIKISIINGHLRAGL